MFIFINLRVKRADIAFFQGSPWSQALWKFFILANLATGSVYTLLYPLLKVMGMCSYTVTLHIRKNTQKSKFLLSQAFKWKKIIFFVIPEMPSKTSVIVFKKVPDHFKCLCLEITLANGNHEQYKSALNSFSLIQYIVIIWIHISMSKYWPIFYSQLLY